MTDFIHKHGILVRLAVIWMLCLSTYIILVLLELPYWSTMDGVKSGFWGTILATLLGCTAWLERWNRRNDE